jgi:hypothetical protein
VIIINKKAMLHMMGGSKVFSAILGILFIAMGLIPLLHSMNVIGFSIPTIPGIVIWILAFIGAIMLVIDGFKELVHGFGIAKLMSILSILMAAFLIVYGLAFFSILPFTLPALGVMIINIVFIVAGILMILGTFMSGI